MLKQIYENKDFILYEDNKGYDFRYDIENKHDNVLEVTIIREDGELETFTLKDWIGLFDSEKYIIDSIMNNDYITKESEGE